MSTNEPYIPEWVKVITNASLAPVYEPMLTLANFTGAAPAPLQVGSFGSIIAIIAVGLLLCFVASLLCVCFLRKRS
jgi:uncharacterized membrane protein